MSMMIASIWDKPDDELLVETLIRDSQSFTLYSFFIYVLLGSGCTTWLMRGENKWVIF